ncbi:MAG: replication initiation protein [Butyrivibrio sp.]|nr:replication initiation protein [Butyrivibrio sp.]
MGRKSKKQMEEESAAIEGFLSNQNYKKANTLINAKGRSTLLVQKLFAVSIAKAELNPEDKTLEANIYGTDLKRIFGVKGGSFYEHIKSAIEPAKNKPSILDWRIIYSNDETQEIEAINVITDASFKNGVLNVRYNNKITPYLANLQSNYTVLSLAEAVQLNSVYSFRLYEILKAEMDRQRAITKRQGPYYVQYNLTDLKLRLGIIDSQADPEIISALKKGNPDYDKIERRAENTDGAGRLKTFGNFKKFALDKAKQELNETTSIWFDYEPVKAGRGGKVVNIRFKIDVNPKVKNSNMDEKTTKKAPAIDEMELYDKVQQLIDEKIMISEIRAILVAANYDYSKIERAYKLAKKSSKKIENLTGWMIRAIEKNWQPTSSEPDMAFGNYEQRTLDFDELERRLVEK